LQTLTDGGTEEFCNIFLNISELIDFRKKRNRNAPEESSAGFEVLTCIVYINDYWSEKFLSIIAFSISGDHAWSDTEINISSALLAEKYIN
jgi:hypothetical protein